MNANSKPKALNNKITIQQWLARATRQLRAAAIESARLDAELLLADALGVDRTWLIAHSDENIDEKTASAALAKRVKREPLAYIRGWQEFYGRRFIVTPDTLIPRPESEMLIDMLRDLPLTHEGTLLDIGTGSGCLGLTAALEFQKLSVVLADTSTQALAVARQNAATLLPPSNHAVQFTQSDLLARTPPATVIVANLPYVATDWHRSPETVYEPASALFANNNGLALIFQLITQATAQLPQGGYLLLEADPRQMPPITTQATANGFITVRQEPFTIALQKV